MTGRLLGMAGGLASLEWLLGRLQKLHPVNFPTLPFILFYHSFMIRF
jgi:hypothetical protein